MITAIIVLAVLLNNKKGELSSVKTKLRFMEDRVFDLEKEVENKNKALLWHLKNSTKIMPANVVAWSVGNDYEDD